MLPKSGFPNMAKIYVPGFQSLPGSPSSWNAAPDNPHGHPAAVRAGWRSAPLKRAEPMMGVIHHKRRTALAMGHTMAYQHFTAI